MCVCVCVCVCVSVCSASSESRKQKLDGTLSPDIVSGRQKSCRFWHLEIFCAVNHIFKDISVHLYKAWGPDIFSPTPLWGWRCRWCRGDAPGGLFRHIVSGGQFFVRWRLSETMSGKIWDIVSGWQFFARWRLSETMSGKIWHIVSGREISRFWHLENFSNFHSHTPPLCNILCFFADPLDYGICWWSHCNHTLWTISQTWLLPLFHNCMIALLTRRDLNTSFF